MTVEQKQGFAPQFQPVSNREALSKIFNIDDILKVLPVHIQQPVMLFTSRGRKNGGNVDNAGHLRYIFPERMG